MRNFIFLLKFNVPKERRTNNAAADAEYERRQDGKGENRGFVIHI